MAPLSSVMAVLTALCLLVGCGASDHSSGTAVVEGEVVAKDESIDVKGQRFDLPVKTLKDLRNRQLLRQQYDYTCGSAALATILNHQYGVRVTEDAVINGIMAMGKSEEEAREEGFSLLDLQKYVESLGFKGTGLGKMEIKDLMAYRVPSVVPVNFGGYQHFLVVRDVKGEWVYVADPAFGNGRVPVKKFEQLWDRRVAFYVLPHEESPEPLVNRMAAQSSDDTAVDIEETPLRQALRGPAVLRHSLFDRLQR